MTMASTLCAVIAMPLLSYLYLNHSVEVPVLSMMRSILLIVLVPVLAGTAINSFYTHLTRRLEGVFPVFSSMAIVLIIAIIVALNQQNISTLALPVLIAVALHNLLGMTVGYFIPRLLKYDTATCRTVSIEVGMQNSGLSVALAMQYFSAAAALPGAIFSIWHNISGSMLAIYWRREKKFSVVIIRLRDNVKTNTTDEAKPLLAGYIYTLEKAGKDASISISEL